MQKNCACAFNIAATIGLHLLILCDASLRSHKMKEPAFAGPFITLITKFDEIIPYRPDDAA
jgi:hypothetical protein